MTNTRTPARRLAGLTDPQRDALAVIAEWGEARISTRTSPAEGTVSTKAAELLERHLLATEPRRYVGGRLVGLTDLGREVAAVMGVRWLP